jgi:GlpG protein
MRSIGVVPTEQDAQRLTGYLLTRGISTQIDASANGYGIWIHDEDRLPAARQELVEFLKNPMDVRYDASLPIADQIRTQQVRAEKDYKRNVRDVRSRWRRPGPQSCPLTIGLIAICVLVSITSRFGAQIEPVLVHLYITLDGQPDGSLQARLPEVSEGQVWRLITPIFIHLSPMHLIFNVFYLYSIGGMLELTRGRWALAGLVLFTAVVSNMSQLLYKGPGFGGMSGVLYGLFGYVWMRARFDPGSGLYLHPDTVTMMMLWLFLCMTGWVGNIANAAHVGGLIAGTAVGIAPVWWRKLTR